MPFQYGEGEDVRLVVSFTNPETGRHYEAGWLGRILPLFSSIGECRARNSYEISLTDSPDGKDRGMINVPSVYFERASPERYERELRQGDRIRLRQAVQGDRESYEAGTLVTVLNTRVEDGIVRHDVAVDFSENLTVTRESLDDDRSGWATVEWSAGADPVIGFAADSPV